MTEWRVGKHYRIHVYEGDRPVATFHDPADAESAVRLHNEAANKTTEKTICGACGNRGYVKGSDVASYSSMTWTRPCPMGCPSPQLQDHAVTVIPPVLLALAALTAAVAVWCRREMHAPWPL